jgi:predicted Zn-dependent protease
MNAFVAGGMNEFFYTGLLQQTDTPEQLLGVMAHETGHIAGGHLIRGQEAMKNASAEAILGTLLAVAAGVASRNGEATMAGLGGAQQIAERNILSFSRAQEASADTAGMTFLDRAGVTSRGLQEFMQKLAGQELLPIDHQAEYVRTHPLTQDRITAIEHHLENSPYANVLLDPKFKIMHERMKAKLLGYLQPEAALLRTTDNDPRVSTRYSRAVAYYQTAQLPRALSLTNGLIKEAPNDPYFLELKAQMLFEGGRVEESVGLYKKVVDLLPDSAIIRIAYGHALLESKDPSRVDLAIQQFQEADHLEERDPETWRFLASAWNRKTEVTGDKTYEGMASYALAEEALTKGADKEARQLADRALKILPKGSSYWIKAQDVKLSIDTNGEH